MAKVSKNVKRQQRKNEKMYIPLKNHEKNAEDLCVQKFTYT